MAKKNITPQRLGAGGIFPHKFAFTLLLPLRNIFISQNKLISRLGLRGHEKVLEVGPGPGYFSLQVARALPQGSLALSDIQPEMLDYARKRIEKKGLDNVSYHLSSGRDFPFEDESFDLIFMVTVLGEVENKKDYCKEFHRLLVPGGLLSISEQPGDPDGMSMAEIKSLMAKWGFDLEKVYGTKKNFTSNFTKKNKEKSYL